MSRKYKQMTRERYDSLKSVVDSLPKGKRGINAVYEALGTTSAQASAIRVSADFDDYRARQRAYAAKHYDKTHKVDNTAGLESFAITDNTLRQDDIKEVLSMLKTIDKKLDDIVGFANLEREIFNELDTGNSGILESLRTKLNIN